MVDMKTYRTKNGLMLELKLSNLIEVFGSNAQGIHGAGHAAHVSRYRGAEYGVGFGRTGMSFAIPTKETPYSAQLSLRQIFFHIDQLYGYAKANPNERFIAGRIGCGLAGISEQDMIDGIASIGEPPRNMRWPNTWMKTIAPDRFYSALIVAGSREAGGSTFLSEKAARDRADVLITEELNKLAVANPDHQPVIITGMASGPDRWGRDYSVRTGTPRIECPSEWDLFGRGAGHIRNQFMAMLGSSVLAIWDGRSPGTKRMIEIAQNDGLGLRIERPARPDPQQEYMPDLFS